MSEDLEKIKEQNKILQEIINIDNWITKFIGDPFLQYGWIKKKEEFEKQLKKLQDKK